MENGQWFKTICRKNNFDVSDVQMELMERYSSALLSWNKKINLISRRDEENIWTKHIVGSISFLFRFRLEPKCSVLDLGTGGGLPGIPLTILEPSLRLTLLDSIQKKINVVHDILSTLNLPNVTALCSRAEELSKRKEYLSSFDYIIARAVAPIKEIIKWSKPLLKRMKQLPKDLQNEIGLNRLIPSGAILLLKGGVLETEIEEAKIKQKPRSLHPHPLSVDGIDPMELSDKKLIIVYP